MIENWKVQRSLHQTYGGRLLLSSFGFHTAVDAQLKFLRDQEKKEAFRIIDTVDRIAFWSHVSNDKYGDGIAGEEEAKRILESPPWK